MVSVFVGGLRKLAEITNTQEILENLAEAEKENNLEIVKEKPEGWRELNGVYCPHGSVVITNQKSFRDKDYTRKLWIY